jgi:lysophospholipase L1-like esterase
VLAWQPVFVHRVCGRKAISSCPLRDYFSALADDRRMLKRAVADDGLHPNDAGYKIMASLAEKAIQSPVNCTQLTLE